MSEIAIGKALMCLGAVALFFGVLAHVLSTGDAAISPIVAEEAWRDAPYWGVVLLIGCYLVYWAPRAFTAKTITRLLAAAIFLVCFGFVEIQLRIWFAIKPTAAAALDFLPVAGAAIGERLVDLAARWKHRSEPASSVPPNL